MRHELTLVVLLVLRPVSLRPAAVQEDPVFEVSEVPRADLTGAGVTHQRQASLLERNIDVGVLSEEPRHVFGLLADQRPRRPAVLINDRLQARGVAPIDVRIAQGAAFDHGAPHLLVRLGHLFDLTRQLCVQRTPLTVREQIAHRVRAVLARVASARRTVHGQEGLDGDDLRPAQLSER